MYIHNFYGDILLSIRVLYDKYIFGSSYIKRYEFNIGNRTFQLPYDLKPNFEFPNMLVSLNDESPAFGQKPEVSQTLKGWNIDQVPVLWNKDTNNIIYVQEEMVLMPITSTINCESQFQAKEIANVIKRWLPNNKFIQFLKFTSFLELSNQFLSSIEFNPNTQDIINIFQKINKRTGDLEYCFGIHYEPFIRLDSISTSIPDSTQRSYQVVIDITYMIQTPLYLYNDQQPKNNVERINFLMDVAFEPISEILLGSTSSNDDMSIGYVKRRILFYEDFSIADNHLMDMLILSSKEVEGRTISFSAIKKVDDFLYISTDDKKFKIEISKLTSTPTSISINDDDTLSVMMDSESNITIYLYQKRKIFPVTFNSSDFILNSNYEYDIILTNSLTGDKIFHYKYLDFVLDVEKNSVNFSFLNSYWDIIKPSLTKPISIQFYDITGKLPKMLMNVSEIPNIMNIQNLTVRSTSVVITWASLPFTTSCIEYGLDETYGNFSNIEDKFTQFHHVIIHGLTPSTEYHYRVNSLDSSDISFISNNVIFSTLGV